MAAATVWILLSGLYQGLVLDTVEETQILMMKGIDEACERGLLEVGPGVEM